MAGIKFDKKFFAILFVLGSFGLIINDYVQSTISKKKEEMEKTQKQEQLAKINELKLNVFDYIGELKFDVIILETKEVQSIETKDKIINILKKVNDLKDILILMNEKELLKANEEYKEYRRNKKEPPPTPDPKYGPPASWNKE